MENGINKQIGELQIANTKQALKFAIPLLVIVFTIINGYAFWTEHEFLMIAFPIISTVIVLAFIAGLYKDFKPQK